MKWLCAMSLVAATVFAASSKSAPPPPPPPYDADLFKKGEQVFGAHAEFLFWRVQEGALDYGLKMRHPAWGPSPSYAQGKFKNATFHGEPGFRVGLSFYRAPHNWEMWVKYTRLTGRGSNSSGKPNPDTEFFTGTWPQVTTLPLAGATSHIHLNYNVVDFLFDRVFQPNLHLRLRFQGGATGAWMNQDWHVHYYTSDGLVSKIRNRWNFRGAGLRVGTMIDWFMDYDIYLTGSASTALLVGMYHNKPEQTSSVALDPADNTAIPIRKADYRDNRPVFSVQMLLGPSWQKNFCSTRWEVFAGYELTTWFNLQEIYRSTSGIASAAKETWINTGLVTLQGLTSRVSVDF